MTPSIRIAVECYPGHGGEEIPRRMRFGDQFIEVAEVVDQWLARDHRYFKVMGANGAIYILRHDVARNIWELTMFSSEKMQGRS